VSRRQANRWSQQEQQQYAQQPPPAQQQYVQQVPPPAAAPAPNLIEQLKGLAELKEQGILTEAEFAAQKAKILAA
jgi:hypothetical protein